MNHEMVSLQVAAVLLFLASLYVAYVHVVHYDAVKKRHLSKVVVLDATGDVLPRC